MKKGDRICLCEMKDDPHPVPDGTIGTVTLIDDIGSVHCTWENGSTLAVIPETDEYVKYPEESRWINDEFIRKFALDKPYRCELDEGKAYTHCGIYCKPDENFQDTIVRFLNNTLHRPYVIYGGEIWTLTGYQNKWAVFRLMETGTGNFMNVQAVPVESKY